MAISPAKIVLFAFLFSAVVIGSSAQRPSKLTHIRVYMHDIIVAENPTAIRVAEAPSTNTSPTSFGAVSVMDDLLTAGPNANSKAVGRVQGMYYLSSLSEFSLTMSMNFVFTSGTYNGSTIAIQGRNAFLNVVREMAVVGGTGVFRFASGYTEVRTITLDSSTNNAVLQYDVYVRH